jgi:hypothetical protein
LSWWLRSTIVDQKLFGERRRHVERDRVAFAALGMPCLPRCDVLLQQAVERLQQASDRQCRRRFGAAPETEREHDAARQLRHQRDVARSRTLVFPGHSAVAQKVLPAVAAADIAGAGPADRIALPFVDRRQCGAERPLLGPQCPAPPIHDDSSTVAVAGGAEVRREQDIGTQFRVTVEPAFDRQHVAANGRGNAQAQGIALVLVHDLDGGDAGRQQPEPVIGDALDLGPETFAIGDDEPEIADLRNVDPRVIDLVDDAEPDREPQPRDAERAPHHVFGAAGPGRWDPRPSGSVFDHRQPQYRFRNFRSNLTPLNRLGHIDEDTSHCGGPLDRLRSR